ncbi:MAG: SDR family oxidoreductase [Deltaproteobacteria bacterium]|nr:MAG: SDR family oxidoreductase [Deltaproteobacteria bacterium]
MRPETSLTGKVGVVTGGGQGIGKGVVKRLLEEGMSVVIAEIDEEVGQEAESQLKHLGPVDVRAWKKGGQESQPELRPVDHAQHPAGRVGRPEDIAALAAFLLSDQAGSITGQTFIADGGMTRKMIYMD